MQPTLERLRTALADRYRLERELGAGGMATVYLAHDERHARAVALKVLRPELAALIGAERFLAEIKVTANLQHPHILPLFDSGEADSFLFYVMPYVQGETLRALLQREKQLGIDAAVGIGRAVASALDYAHRHGVIHRDIKPENILLHDGQALVADFGIALALSQAGGARLTETGLSIGTPQYMSPEQAMGDRELDARSDVYSLGAMLYEMLAGDPPYTGSTAQAIVAQVITEKPRPLRLRRDTVPVHTAAAIHKALAKLPADRFSSAAEFSAALITPGSVPLWEAGDAAGPAGVERPPVWRDRRVLVPAAVALLLAAAAAWGWLRRPAGEAETVRFSAALPEAAKPVLDYSFPIAVSPDGRTVVHVGRRENGGTQLYARTLDRLVPMPVGGTDSAHAPVFSPDGRWLAFFAGTRLKKVPLGGGQPVTLADSAPAPDLGQAAAWLDDGTIVFVNARFALLRVSESGGAAEPVLANDTASRRDAGSPTPLPGARAVLFLWCRNKSCDHLDLAVLDLKRRTAKVLIEDASGGWYLPSGQLAFARGDGSVFVVPFDLGGLALTGPPSPVVEGVRMMAGQIAQLAVGGGALAYIPGDAAVRNLMVQVDRDGTEHPLAQQLNDYIDPRYSPDGRRIAVEIHDAAGNGHIWIYDIQSVTLTRLTREGHDARPTWSPDGRRILFSSSRSGGWKGFLQPADGSAPAEKVIEVASFIRSKSFAPDGRQVVFGVETDNLLGASLYAVELGSGQPPRRVSSTTVREVAPALSPDGRWLAYVSDESGRDEVYVRPFPNPGGRWAVSVEGGREPVWAASGHELYYRARDGLWAAALEFTPDFRVTRRQLLFSDAPYERRENGAGYDVDKSGKHFLFVKIAGSAADPIIVTHWLAELKRTAVLRK